MILYVMLYVTVSLDNNKGKKIHLNVDLKRNFDKNRTILDNLFAITTDLVHKLSTTTEQCCQVPCSAECI